MPECGDLQRISRAEVSRERKSILKQNSPIPPYQLFYMTKNITNNDLEAFLVGFAMVGGRLAFEVALRSLTHGNREFLSMQSDAWYYM